MRISIVIPVYNLENYIIPCLQSILNQRGPQFDDPERASPLEEQQVEVLVVDDASTDDSASVCEKFAVRFPDMKIIRNRHAGVSETRNTGLRAASGDYVLFLDGDDFLTPDALASLFACIDTEQPDIVFMSFNDYSEETGQSIYYPLRFDPAIIAGGDGEEILTHLMRSNETAVWNICRHLFNRNFLMEHNLQFDPTLDCSEDCFFFFQSVLAGHSFQASVLPVYNYRQGRAGSLITTMNMKCLHDKLKTSVRWIERMKNNSEYEEKHDQTILTSLAREMFD